MGAELAATLENSQAGPSDWFGYSVATSGDIVAVGVPNKDYSGATNTGRVDLFSTSTGERLRTLTNPTPGTGDSFGFSVAMSDNSLVVGTPGAYDGGATNSGAVYVYNLATEDPPVAIHNPSVEAWDQFGYSVAVSGDTVVVGTPFADYSGETNPGAVYIFNRTTGSHTGTIVNPSVAEDDYFGFSVAISGPFVVVGTPNADFSNRSNPGAAYVYNLTTEAHIATLIDPSPANYDYFGRSVAISGTTVVVGTVAQEFGSIENAGTAFVFDLTPGSPIVTLENPTPAVWDEFGSAVAVSGDTVVIGTRANDYSGVSDAGAVYLFSATSGQLLQTINPAPAAGNQFGFSVAMSGDIVVAGMPRADAPGVADAPDVADVGRAYVYNTVVDPRQSAILAQGQVTVTARYLNINGLIQSGVQTMTLHVAKDFTATATTSLLDKDGAPLPGISFGEDGVPVNGYFDASFKADEDGEPDGAIVVDELVPKGGLITLAGQILSTGNGQLKVAHGYASVDIDNQSPYALIVNRIDTTKRREGRITIVDTARLQKVEFVVDGQLVCETVYQGTLRGATPDGGDGPWPQSITRNCRRRRTNWMPKCPTCRGKASSTFGRRGRRRARLR